jgi:hypothetical protein
MFLFLLAALGLISASPIPAPSTLFIQRSTQSEVVDKRYEGIRLVYCEDDEGNAWWGTMVHYSKDRYLSVSHVASNGLCYDAKTMVPLKVTLNDGLNDFAIFQSPIPLDNKILKISCDSFKINQTYYSIGWAEGQYLIKMPLKAMNKYTNKRFTVDEKPALHFRLLQGKIIPGMSGGPMIDENWVIHGMNNAVWDDINTSYSRELADTAVCK